MEELGCGDGVGWVRGSVIGRGGFGCVYLATPKNPKSKYRCLPAAMAVKSAEVSISCSIQKERQILSNLKGCPNVIKCFGEETTMADNGMLVYNLLLEYGSGGTLADRIKKSGGNGLPEIESRMYTRSILRGLNYIHNNGYVHCDLKPENVLLVGVNEFVAKIGDFGLSKRAEESKKRRKRRRLEPYWRGTPMYLSPEAVLDRVQEVPCDVWALGCVVLEMLTGRAPWEERKPEEILRRIGAGNELPRIPDGVSAMARNFLKGCFVRKPGYRLTCEMLLNHPFVKGFDDDDDDDDGVEELDEIEDLNEVESMALVLNDSDDEWGDDLSKDSYSCWYDECGDGIVDLCDSDSKTGCKESDDLGFREAKKRRQEFPLSFTIPTG